MCVADAHAASPPNPLVVNVVGTPDYIAPEVLLKKGYGKEAECVSAPAWGAFACAHEGSRVRHRV
jgi:serine/threonine protein kinase